MVKRFRYFVSCFNSDDDELIFIVPAANEIEACQHAQEAHPYCSEFVCLGVC